MDYLPKNDNLTLVFPHLRYFHDNANPFFFFSVFHSITEEDFYQRVRFWLCFGFVFFNFCFQQLKQVQNIKKRTECWILAVFRQSLKKFSIALLTQKLENDKLIFFG